MDHVSTICNALSDLTIEAREEDIIKWGENSALNYIIS